MDDFIEPRKSSISSSTSPSETSSKPPESYEAPELPDLSRFPEPIQTTRAPQLAHLSRLPETTQTEASEASEAQSGTSETSMLGKNDKKILGPKETGSKKKRYSKKAKSIKKTVLIGLGLFLFISLIVGVFFIVLFGIGNLLCYFHFFY